MPLLSPRAPGVYRGIAPTLLAIALAVPLAGCEWRDDPAADDPSPQESPEASASPSAEDEGQDSEESPAAAIELEQSVENPPWRGEVGEPPDQSSTYQISVYNDELGPDPTHILVRPVSAEQTADGMAFELSFTWNVAEQTGEIYHDQFYVEAGGERYTTGEDGVLTSYALAEGGSEMVIEHSLTIPEAPVCQGEGYATDGTGLPPIGVCYQAGGEFSIGTCG